MSGIFHSKERSFLDPVGTIVDELQALIQVLIAETSWMVFVVIVLNVLDL